MLGRKDYTQTELASGRAAVASQLATFANVAGALGAKADKKAQAVREEFEAVYFNNMVLVLDRLFVHRIRQVAGKDGTPLNELELLAE